MTQRSLFRCFKTSPEVIRFALMLCVRLSLSLRSVEDLLHKRGIEASHERVRFWLDYSSNRRWLVSCQGMLGES